ncbi:MAG TPA: mechanosensitive ion channel family protein [Acidobacteriota bacterium]|jgi:small-conductance mechanosensitive channel|nr:mechanosensitive ion channel family protein [Acidobacteriota bacterium]
MSTHERTEVERIQEQQDVKRALEQTSGAKAAVPPAAEPSEKLWLASYALVLAILGSLRYLFRIGIIPVTPRYLGLVQRLTAGAMFFVVIFGSAKIIDVYLIGPIQSAVSRYNLRRILRLVVVMLLALIVISIIFVNWYTTIVSLGLISLILSFSLQTPVTSFIGWIYILVREPYRVGDRIRIGDATGDVIDVSYLDTTLWEVGGQYLSTDHPSGRIIKFPNSRVLNSPIYNYSWPLFPYIWNEIKFQIAYESDLEFVAKIMKEVAEKELGEHMMERVKVYRDLLAKTPVDELTVQERPVVMFRVNENSWLEAIVRYLVSPKEAGRIKTALIKKMLAQLNAAPDRVLFPKGNAR